MDFDLLYPGRFLKSGEFKGRDVTLTMTGVELEDLPQDKGGDKARGIISFRETKKKLVLNRTNGEALKALFGRETDDWIDKKVTLYPAPYEGDETCIRVRGAPHLTKPLTFELKLPRKKPISVTLIPTGKNGKKPVVGEDVDPPLSDDEAVIA